MKRRSLGKRRKPTIALPLLVLLGALLVSVPAGCSTLRFWLGLPQLRASLFGSEEVQAAFDRARRNTTPEAREAFALRLASNTLAGALTHKVEPERLQTTVADAVRPLSRSQVGRLQQAAARLWLLEQTGKPVEAWWPSLRVFFEGMERANLAHYQQALTQHWARAYESVGVGPGTACGLAENVVGHPHGPFLQYLVERLRRVIDEREQAGDEAAAATCRGVLYRLLRQWVLEPGPAGLRLLAADLLAGSLETDLLAGTSSQTHAIALTLRAWRSKYHRAAGRRPVAILNPDPKPALAPGAHERLLKRVALTTWLGSATLAAGAVGILLGWSWLGRGRGVIRGRRLALCAVAAVFVVTVAGLAWIQLWPDSIRADLRGDFSSLRYWWRHPFVAAGLTLALVLVAGLMQRPTPGRESRLVARLGAAAIGSWLVLAVTLWGGALAGELARRDYEHALRAAHQDAIAAMAGPDAVGLLARLREWEP